MKKSFNDLLRRAHARNNEIGTIIILLHYTFYNRASEREKVFY